MGDSCPGPSLSLLALRGRVPTNGGASPEPSPEHQQCSGRPHAWHPRLPRGGCGTLTWPRVCEEQGASWHLGCNSVVVEVCSESLGPVICTPTPLLGSTLLPSSPDRPLDSGMVPLRDPSLWGLHQAGWARFSCVMSKPPPSDPDSATSPAGLWLCPQPAPFQAVTRGSGLGCVLCAKPQPARAGRSVTASWVPPEGHRLARSAVTSGLSGAPSAAQGCPAPVSCRSRA